MALNKEKNTRVTIDVPKKKHVQLKKMVKGKLCPDGKKLTVSKMVNNWINERII